LLDSLAEDNFVVPLPLQPPLELSEPGGDFVLEVGVFETPVVTVSTVEESLDFVGGKSAFLPSSMSLSKTSPMTAPRCGV